MQTRSSSKITRDQTSNPTSSTTTTPKGRNCRGSKQKVENSNLEENLPPVVTMADNHTMAELLRAPTEGYAEAIVVPPILTEQFELKHSLINMMTSDQFFELEKDNPHDHIHQDSLNAAAGGNLLERSTQDVLTIIENKSKVRNSRSKPIASQVKACNVNSNSEIAKLTHAVNKQTSAVTTAMTAMLKQFQATSPPAPVKAVEEICVTCRGAHPYYQCLAADGNTFPEFKDNIQGYMSAAVVNYNQAQQNQNFHLNELEKIKRMNEVSMKAMQTQIDMVKNELRNEMKTSIQTSLSNKTNEIKNMMASLLQMNTTSTSGSGSLPSNTVANPKGKLKAITTHSGLVTDGPTVPTPPKSITPEVDERVDKTYTDPDLAEYTIKQLHLNITLVEALVIMLKYQKMLKALFSNKEKLQELANTPLNENCSTIILKKLPKKLRDPGKFLIPCGFSKLKCKALADLDNRAICTPAGIVRDVFVPVGKFTFPADFVIVDYKSDPRVPLILGKPFLRTDRALIDVHGEEMILREGNERLTLNMKHDTSSYSNHPQRESVNLINIFNVSSEDFLEVSFSNQPSGNPNFSPHQELTSREVNHDIHDSQGCNDIHPHFDDNPLSGSTTYFSNSLLEEFTDELALITYPTKYDDNLQFDIDSDIKEIEFLLYQDKDSSLKDSIDQTDLENLKDNFVDPIPEMLIDEYTLDYSSPLIFDVYDDDFLEVESDVDNVYDDPFDSKGEKIKESKLLIDELGLPCDFLLYFEYDSFNSQDFSRVDALPSTNNETKVFNPGILIQEKPVKIITRVAQDKKLAISNASLVLEDFDPPFYEPLFFKDIPKSKMLLPFSTENEEKVFKPGIYTSEKVKEKQEKDKIGTKPNQIKIKREAWKSLAMPKSSMDGLGEFFLDPLCIIEMGSIDDAPKNLQHWSLWPFKPRSLSCETQFNDYCECSLWLKHVISYNIRKVPDKFRVTQFVNKVDKSIRRWRGIQCFVVVDWCDMKGISEVSLVDGMVEELVKALKKLVCFRMSTRSRRNIRNVVKQRVQRMWFLMAFGEVGDEEVVVGEGVVVTSSSLEMLTNSCLGMIMVSLIFLEGLEEEALVEFIVEFFEEDEDGTKNEKDGLFNLKANDQSRKA
uniref:Reverse transcriptase domain-containing protein n=1 Tax=Tanacetum cinerariifolium TaxID=118510 RepID=A0A6L2JGE4_TANCI|nr:hypothetical protein [Tanacetum cinerariifolium]